MMLLNLSVAAAAVDSCQDGYPAKFLPAIWAHNCSLWLNMRMRVTVDKTTIPAQPLLDIRAHGLLPGVLSRNTPLLMPVKAALVGHTAVCLLHARMYTRSCQLLPAHQLSCIIQQLQGAPGADVCAVSAAYAGVLIHKYLQRKDMQEP
jgi:hypothetical protein